jgi:hypothetical protein
VAEAVPTINSVLAQAKALAQARLAQLGRFIGAECSSPAAHDETKESRNPGSHPAQSLRARSSISTSAEANLDHPRGFALDHRPLRTEWHRQRAPGC